MNTSQEMALVKHQTGMWPWLEALLPLSSMDREDNCRRASYRLNLYGFLPKGSYLGIARDKFQPQPMQIGTVVFCRDWKVPTIHPFYSWSQADQGQLLGLLGALMKLIFLLLLRRLDRIAGVPPDTEAEPAWHQPLGKKAAEYRLFPETGAGGLLIRMACFPNPASQPEKYAHRQGEKALCVVHAGEGKQLRTSERNRSAPPDAKQLRGCAGLCLWGPGQSSTRTGSSVQGGGPPGLCRARSHMAASSSENCLRKAGCKAVSSLDTQGSVGSEQGSELLKVTVSNQTGFTAQPLAFPPSMPFFYLAVHPFQFSSPGIKATKHFM
jgi:hypothetical protein